ncbi:hypothetical protein CEXT_245731 [Caerostris extrusa]|uniref:Uncharacterized protein n=1 Tax=Caerostris extrusa TaxID=172846 RepID=A0AAV4NFB5_CAEEX|nr:hypothetical protein CEXT_245731 [Caerostris extrusa]
MQFCKPIRCESILQTITNNVAADLYHRGRSSNHLTTSSKRKASSANRFPYRRPLHLWTWQQKKFQGLPPSQVRPFPPTRDNKHLVIIWRQQPETFRKFVSPASPFNDGSQSGRFALLCMCLSGPISNYCRRLIRKECVSVCTCFVWFSRSHTCRLSSGRSSIVS